MDVVDDAENGGPPSSGGNPPSRLSALFLAPTGWQLCWPCAMVKEKADGSEGRGGVWLDRSGCWAGQRPTPTVIKTSLFACPVVHQRERPTDSFSLKVAASKSLTACRALRINSRSNIPRILKHSLVIRVYRQVDRRLIPIILAEGIGIFGTCKPHQPLATCTARTQGSRLKAYSRCE